MPEQTSSLSTDTSVNTALDGKSRKLLPWNHSGWVSLLSHKSQYSLENHRSTSLIPAFSSADLRTSYASLHQSLTSFITHPHFPCPARRASDSASVLDVCLCRFMNPVHLTDFWDRHATVQLKPKAVLEYLLQLFFFQLSMFLVPFGCSVVTIDGTVMPSSCVLRTAHPVPWEAALGKTAGMGRGGRHCSSWCESQMPIFPSILLSMPQLHE